MKRLLAVACLGAAVLTGCAAPQRLMTIDEAAVATHRVFKGVTTEQALAAAERVLWLADGDDFAIDRERDELMATRNWTIYLVLGFVTGTDQWIVKARPVDGGTDVTFAVGSVAQPAGARITPRRDGDPRPRVMGSMHEGTAIYDLVWSRMAYLLGQRDSWMTCADSAARVASGVVWGEVVALCNSFNVKDQMPEGPMITAPEALQRNLSLPDGPARIL